MWEKGTRGLGKSPSGVQGQSPDKGSGGPPEADAYLLMNAQILTFWRNKLVKQSEFRHYTVRKKTYGPAKGGGGIAHWPLPKYATDQYSRVITLRQKTETLERS